MKTYDVAIIGAGAAGMFCAGIAAQRGRSVVLIDHATKLGEKIRISGGGRCNFTNQDVSPANFVSNNPDFCRSALARYSPQDFMKLVRSHGVGFHQKHRGQMFCDDSADDIIAMLRSECNAGGVEWMMPCQIQQIKHSSGTFALQTNLGAVCASKVVVACGGLSIPKIGATGFGYEIAQQFGHEIVPTRPSLVPLTFSNEEHTLFSPLAGVALPALISTIPSATVPATRGGKTKPTVFIEDILFTHRGLSGPGVLQITNYLQPGQSLRLNLMPHVASADELFQQWQGARSGNRKLATHLLESLPSRLAQEMIPRALGAKAGVKIADLSNADLQHAAQTVAHWIIKPTGNEGYKKAEVTLGGVDTRHISSNTMQSNLVPGLHFIGEVMDVTGWLGGYNFQWAWASGYACGMSL